MRRHASGWEARMLEWVAGILTLFLLAYLTVALLKPEWFA
jgi:K+-transporting ATPase KdpF subunit